MSWRRLLDTPSTLGASLGLLVLRLGAAGLMLSHGWGKLTGFGQRRASFPDPIGLGSELSMALAVFAEFFCAIAVVLGLLTRFAAVPLMVTMAVAALVVHADDPLEKKELAFLYLACFSALLLAGPGRFSVDSLLLRRRV